jgi:hypothetical protein
MLVIRKEQMAAFEVSFRERFEVRMAEHLTTYFPAESDRLGPDLAAFVRRNTDKALQYGINSEREVCIYLDLAMTYGEQFDRELSWSQKILTDPALGSPAKIERMLQIAIHE